MLKKNGEITNIANSLVLASSILIFHVILLAGLGVLVLFFSGIVNYIFWIFLAGSALITGSVFLFYRYMKKEGSSMFLKILSSPELQGKNVEVNLLGGLASIKVGDGHPSRIRQEIETNVVPVSRQLEDPESSRLRELTELARMLENDLITLEEFNRVKKSLLN